STPLIVYAALVTLLPVLMLVNAGATNTIKIAMIPMTSINSSSVKAKRSRSFGGVKAKRSRSSGNVKALRRSRWLSVKTRRVGNGDTNLRVQQSLEIVNNEK